jgi:hypothetical protein
MEKVPTPYDPPAYSSDPEVDQAPYPIRRTKQYKRQTIMEELKKIDPEFCIFPS